MNLYTAFGTQAVFAEVEYRRQLFSVAASRRARRTRRAAR
jgi:hypothetical protein